MYALVDSLSRPGELSQKGYGSLVNVAYDAYDTKAFRPKPFLVQSLIQKRLTRRSQALEVDFGGQSFRYPAELLRVESLSADNLRVDVKGQKRVRYSYIS